MEYWSIDENKKSLKSVFSLLHHSSTPLLYFLSCINCLTKQLDWSILTFCLLGGLTHVRSGEIWRQAVQGKCW
jgi:hypothetical protein